jgi:hypothetical protein
MTTLVGSAFAQAPEPPAPTPAPAPATTYVPPPPPERHGLFASGGLWGGNISCDGMDCGNGFREAGGVNLSIGWMFTPRFGLLFDAWAMTSSKNDVSITFITTTLDVRYWLTRALWVQGGVGSGHATVTWHGISGSGDDVPVGTVGAGFEIVRGRNWAIDVAFKVAQGSRTDENNDVHTGRSTGLGVSFVGFL